MLYNAIQGFKGALDLVQKMHCHLPTRCNLLFESQELNTNTLPESAAQLEGPSCSQEAWLRLKTWFAWVHPFNQGSSVRPSSRAEGRNLPEKSSRSPHRQFEPNIPLGHRFFRTCEVAALLHSLFSSSPFVISWLLQCACPKFLSNVVGSQAEVPSLSRLNSQHQTSHAPADPCNQLLVQLSKLVRVGPTTVHL
jgi:hypothetical protein